MIGVCTHVERIVSWRGTNPQQEGRRGPALRLFQHAMWSPIDSISVAVWLRWGRGNSA